MERISERMLQTRVDWLNDLTDQPKTSYTRDEGGKLRANIGNYHLSHAYGGVNLCQMVNEDGGVTTIFSCGHIPKRQLFDRLCAYMDGIEAGLKMKEGKAVSNNKLK